MAVKFTSNFVVYFISFIIVNLNNRSRKEASGIKRLTEEGSEEKEEKPHETKVSLVAKFLFFILLIVWNIGGIHFTFIRFN